jgi:hypothetical protein
VWISVYVLCACPISAARNVLIALSARRTSLIIACTCPLLHCGWPAILSQIEENKMRRVFTLSSLLLVFTVLAKANDPVVLTFLDGNTTALAEAITKEKECATITIVTLFGRKPFNWFMSQGVGNGHGGYEIYLEHMTPGEARGIFLGTNVKKAASRACKIMNGKQAWVGIPTN